MSEPDQGYLSPLSPPEMKLGKPFCQIFQNADDLKCHTTAMNNFTIYSNTVRYYSNSTFRD